MTKEINIKTIGLEYVSISARYNFQIGRIAFGRSTHVFIAYDAKGERYHRQLI